MESKSEGCGCFSFMGLLALLFIALKLCKVIAWSWIWVLSPIWVVAVALLVAAVMAAFFE